MSSICSNDREAMKILDVIFWQTVDGLSCAFSSPRGGEDFFDVRLVLRATREMIRDVDIELEKVRRRAALDDQVLDRFIRQLNRANNAFKGALSGMNMFLYMEEMERLSEEPGTPLLPSDVAKTKLVQAVMAHLDVGDVPAETTAPGPFCTRCLEYIDGAGIPASRDGRRELHCQACVEAELQSRVDALREVAEIDF